MTTRPQSIWERAVWKATAAIITLVGMVVALTVAVIAIDRASAVGSCTNTNLASRNAPAQADAKAHILNAQAQLGFLNALAQAPNDAAARRAAFAKYQAAEQTYVQTLLDDQQTRDNHPLGQC